MGKFVEQRERQKAFQERKRMQQETMGKYFYDLSKLTFAAMVLGSAISFFQGAGDKWVLVIVLGVLFALILAYIGNNILK